MKNGVLLLFLFCGLGPLAAQQHVPRTDLDVNKLKGRVKTLVAHQYQLSEDGKNKKGDWVFSDSNWYNQAGNLSLEISHSVEPMNYYRNISDYDVTGRYLSHYISYWPGNIADEETFTEYDTNGRELRYTNWWFRQGEREGEGDTIIRIEQYVYDIMGHLVEIRTSDNDDEVISEPYRETVNTFDRRGNLVRQERFDQNGKHMYTYVNEYDTAGRRLKYYRLEGDSYTAYMYDAAGTKTAEKEYGTGGRLVSAVTYDAQGNTLTYVRYDTKGSIETNVAYRYAAFDRKGNWTKMYSYHVGQMTHYLERKLTYYK